MLTDDNMSDNGNRNWKINRDYENSNYNYRDISMLILNACDENHNLFTLACAKGYLNLVLFIYDMLVWFVDNHDKTVTGRLFQYFNQTSKNVYSANYGKTAYIRACEKGDIKMMKTLINHCNRFVDVTIGKKIGFIISIYENGYYTQRGSDFFRHRFGNADNPIWDKSDQQLYHFLLENEKQRQLLLDREKQMSQHELTAVVQKKE